MGPRKGIFGEQRDRDGLEALHGLHRADEDLEEEARHAQAEHVQADPAHALLGLESDADEGHEEAHGEADEGGREEAEPRLPELKAT